MDRIILYVAVVYVKFDIFHVFENEVENESERITVWFLKFIEFHVYCPSGMFFFSLSLTPGYNCIMVVYTNQSIRLRLFIQSL